MVRLLIGAALLATTFARGARAGCLDGTYRVVGDPLLSSAGGAFVGDAITIANGTVAIASGCPAVQARIRTTPRGTIVRAQWRACGALAAQVRLRATVNKPCRVMKGLFGQARRRLRRFVAQNEVCPPGPAACRPCTKDADCRNGLFCAKATGGCHGAGACRPRPLRCPRAFVAVCGCDGVTYPGPCEAARQGIDVAHVGACEAVCGGIAGVECTEGHYCELPAGECGTADLEGVCVEAPVPCPLISAPVCGCDGTTYANDCVRRGARAQKAYDGPCAAACSEACDCYRTQTFPEPCPLDCATCDNYWTCETGSCVAHCGPVPQPPPACEPKGCGTIVGIPCPAGQFCDLPIEQCSGADLEGRCTQIPEACIQVYAPVCGCDGVTYGNDCERQAAQAQKAHDGACDGVPCAGACDCYANGVLPSWCSALACPACGCAWHCEDGTCVVHVETPRPDPACR